MENGLLFKIGHNVVKFVMEENQPCKEFVSPQEKVVYHAKELIL